MASDSYLPFTQRTGLEPIPPQLQLGDLPQELRRRLFYAVHKEMERESDTAGGYRWFEDDWKELARDLHVLFFKGDADKYVNRVHLLSELIKGTIYNDPFGRVFNLLEFIMRHSASSSAVVSDFTSAFEECRAAYRVADNLEIVAVGTAEQAEAFARAIEQAKASNMPGVRKHLIDAGVALRKSDWPGCVRESIHAVEAMAVRLAPGTDVLGEALKVIEKQGHLHGGLKAAFSSLYGYSSDEEGVRHALVFGDEANVDEADALFMLGACASFVSYLLVRAA